MLTDNLYEKYRTIKAQTDTLDVVDGPSQEITLDRPAPADSKKNRLGNTSVQHDKLLLTGANVLDFVQHYSDTSGGRFYFRGESLYSTKLIPSLLRPHNLNRLLDSWGSKNPRDLEHKLLHRFKRYTWHMFQAESDFPGQELSYIASLCVAQHHGLPTMLLDWSLNPFIALFFAARYPTRFIGHEDKLNPATVWVMKLQPPEKRPHLTIHLEEDHGSKHHNGTQHQDPQHIIDSNGRESPLIVVPLSFTRRIDAQSGRFIYCGCMSQAQLGHRKNKNHAAAHSSLRDWHNDKPWVKIDQWIIPAEQRDEVLKQIRILGFHDGKMFPDLKGWANYLQAGHK